MPRNLFRVWVWLGLRNDDETNERAKILLMGAIGMIGLVMTLFSTEIIIQISGVVITFVMCVGIWYGILAGPAAKIKVTDKKCEMVSGNLQIMLKLHNKGKGREITVAAWNEDGSELVTGWSNSDTATAKVNWEDANKFLDSRRQAWAHIRVSGKRVISIRSKKEIDEPEEVDKHYVKIQFYEAAQIYIYSCSRLEHIEEVGMYMEGLFHRLGRYKVKKKLKDMGLNKF